MMIKLFIFCLVIVFHKRIQTDRFVQDKQVRWPSSSLTTIAQCDKELVVTEKVRVQTLVRYAQL